MNTRTHICPRDDYPLVPVYSVEDRKRRIIALSCPEPYCDHMQLVPKNRSEELERFFRHEPSTIVPSMVVHTPDLAQEV